jgi:ribosomal protein S18 acetylase RimI-like enzyme
MNSSFIRQGRPEDAEAIAQIHIASWRVAYRGIIPAAILDQLSVSQWTEDWKKRLQPSEHLTFVLETNGILQGWASIGPARDENAKRETGELYGIYLDPQCWSKGLGTSLYLRTENAMLASGFKEASLWVLEANVRAQSFYGRMGYLPDGETKYTRKENVSLKELRYKKSLAPDDGQV